VKALDIASRVGAAVVGGYALAAAVALGATALPGPRAEAVQIGIMLGFLAYAAATIWAFAARSAIGAWAGLIGPAAVLALIGWIGAS
jgi:hypothetical protein